MIYFASYFMPEYHHGQRISISRSEPKGFKVDGKLEFLAPSPGLLQWWKVKGGGQRDWDEYCRRYRVELNNNRDPIFEWIDSHDRYGKKLGHDYTLLCWEKSAQMCHRSIVREFALGRYLPMYDGGESAPAIAVGDEVDWVMMPDYLYAYVETPLRVKAIFERDGHTFVRLRQIDKDISIHLVRPHAKETHHHLH